MITKPEDFNDAYVTILNAPYVREPPYDVKGAGGVLAKGQVVWVHSSEVPRIRSGPVRAFVDYLGVILVNANYLKSV